MDTLSNTSPTGTEPALDEVETATAGTDDAAYVEDELLVEEISIDGMCGVY